MRVDGSKPGSTTFDRALDARQDADALRGESRQARRHAAEVRAEASVILDAVAELMSQVLGTWGFELRAPVVASFRTQRGSTGVEVVVPLADPAHADAARAVLDERFPDPLSTLIVG